MQLRRSFTRSRTLLTVMFTFFIFIAHQTRANPPTDENPPSKEEIVIQQMLVRAQKEALSILIFSSQFQPKIEKILVIPENQRKNYESLKSSLRASGVGIPVAATVGALAYGVAVKLSSEEGPTVAQALGTTYMTGLRPFIGMGALIDKLIRFHWPGSGSSLVTSSVIASLYKSYRSFNGDVEDLYRSERLARVVFGYEENLDQKIDQFIEDAEIFFRLKSNQRKLNELRVGIKMELIRQASESWRKENRDKTNFNYTIDVAAIMKARKILDPNVADIVEDLKKIYTDAMNGKFSLPEPGEDPLELQLTTNRDILKNMVSVLEELLNTPDLSVITKDEIRQRLPNVQAVLTEVQLSLDTTSK